MALPKGETYFGHVIVSFDLKELPASTLALDFKGKLISHLNINGQQIINVVRESKSIFINHKVNLPNTHLKIG